MAWRHIKCFCESRPNVCSLQPAGHNHFFGECFQLMGFRAVPFILWCCPLFLPNHDIDEYSPKCIYQQWNIFHIGYIDFNFSGSTNIIWDYVSEEASWFSVSQLSQVSHTEAGSSYGKEYGMGLLIDTFCWLKPPLYHILIAVWWIH